MNPNTNQFDSKGDADDRLAESQALTAYDAAYLELALRFGVPLATQDAALIAAAQALGVPLLPTA